MLVPTHGVTPKIIDMGFAYAKGMEGSEVTVDLSHSDRGYFCNRYSWLTDYKVFLVSLFADVKEILKENDSVFGEASVFMNIVKNLFKSLNISWHSGWDKYKGDEASDKTIHRIAKSSV